MVKSKTASSFFSPCFLPFVVLATVSFVCTELLEIAKVNWLLRFQGTLKDFLRSTEAQSLIRTWFSPNCVGRGGKHCPHGSLLYKLKHSAWIICYFQLQFGLALLSLSPTQSCYADSEAKRSLAVPTWQEESCSVKKKNLKKKKKVNWCLI